MLNSKCIQNSAFYSVQAIDFRLDICYNVQYRQFLVA